MTGSAMSSDSLSSPSPTPPPHPAPAPSQPRSSASASKSLGSSLAANRRPPSSGATGLDSGSELSELTEDEQENGINNMHESKKRSSTRDEDDDEDDDDTPDTDKRPPPPLRRPMKTRRRKRSSIVPAPMWGWASKEQRALEEEEATREEEEEEEEEEEDVPHPPRPMEEEEGDDDEEDDATTKNIRAVNVKQSQSIRARMRATQYRGHGTGAEDDEDEGADPSYVRPTSSNRKPHINGRHPTGDSASEDGGTWGDDDDDDDEVGVKPQSKSSKRHLRDNDDGPEVSGVNSNVDPSLVQRDAKALSKKAESEADPDYESTGEAEDDDEPGATANPQAQLLTAAIPSAAPAPVFSPTRVIAPKPVSPTRGRFDAGIDDTDTKLLIPSSNGLPTSVVDDRAESGSSVASSREASPAPSAKASDDEEEDDQRISLAAVARQRKASLMESVGLSAPNRKTDEPSKRRTATPAKGTLMESNRIDPDGDVEMAQDPDVEAELQDNDDGDRSVGDIDPDGDVDVEGEENEGDKVDNDDDMEHDNELESDLQPAHRAEALDVLASIELKWALLRERIYLEKMEGLTWEEELVKQGNHPEMIHLLGELTNRRDKRIELASRKRVHEIANVGKRRRAEESATWSWWTVSRDELQTDMISETNRKRRRLERERRAIERPQPIRRIPPSPTSVPPAPSLRKIVKSLPFVSGMSKQKLDYTYQTADFVYPELPTLSSADVAADLEFLLQNRRHSTYDSRDHRHTSVNPTTSAGNGPVNGLPNQGLTYEQAHYNDAYGRPPAQSSGSAYAHHPIGNGPVPGGNYPFLAGPPPAGRVPQHHQSGPSGSSNPAISGHAPNHHVHPQQSHGHPDRERAERERERELELASPAMGGPGHQLHPYFGQGRNGGPATVYPTSASHLQEQQFLMGPRRSPSPVLNGDSSAPKHNRDTPTAPPPGTWLGLGMGMGTYVSNSKPDWVERRMLPLDGPNGESEEKWMRERDERERERVRERGEREKRDREKEREVRDLDRAEREQMDIENERQRDYLQQFGQLPPQQQHHRQQPPSSHPHPHSVPPGGPHGAAPHHHHHRAPPHHHHVVHHHHSQSSSSSHPPPLVNGGHTSSSVPPGISGHSPRVSRDYDSRGQPSDVNPGSNLPGGPEQLWKGEPVQRSSSLGIRERERDKEREKERERERDTRKPVGPPPGTTGVHFLDERDRPLPVPLSLGSSSHSVVSGNPPAHTNGTASPRAHWNPADDGYRPSSGNPQEQQTRSPGHRYSNPSTGHIGRGPPPPSGPSPLQNSIAASPPRRPPPPQSPGSSSSYMNSTIQHSPSRYGPPPPLSMQANRASPVGLKMRPSSPTLSKGPSHTSSYSSSPRLAGPGRTSTPTSAPPLVQNGPGRPGAYPPPPRGRSTSPSSRSSGLPALGPAPPIIGSAATRERDRDWERHGPPIPPSKMSLPQMVDGL